MQGREANCESSGLSRRTQGPPKLHLHACLTFSGINISYCNYIPSPIEDDNNEDTTHSISSRSSVGVVLQRLSSSPAQVVIPSLVARQCLLAAARYGACVMLLFKAYDTSSRGAACYSDIKGHSNLCIYTVFP